MALTATIAEQRLAGLAPLATGSHSPDSVACVMEAVAYVAGEVWSDHPACACPVISAFLRAWNDDLPDESRDVLLRPLVLRLVGSKATKVAEWRRSLMAADWLVRTHTPAWLRLAKLDAQADALSSLPEITSMTQARSFRHPIVAARRDAVAAWTAVWTAAEEAERLSAGVIGWGAVRAAAGLAARDAAWSAARAAAGLAARDAAWSAAGAAAWSAAGAAAGLAARSAAGLAARSAARDAVGAALAPVRDELQQSALALVHRMLDVREAP